MPAYGILLTFIPRLEMQNRSKPGLKVHLSLRGKAEVQGRQRPPSPPVLDPSRLFRTRHFHLKTFDLTRVFPKPVHTVTGSPERLVMAPRAAGVKHTEQPSHGEQLWQRWQRSCGSYEGGPTRQRQHRRGLLGPEEWPWCSSSTC